MNIVKLNQELINEIEKSCELTKVLVKHDENIINLIESLDITEDEKIKLTECVKEYINYGCFSGVSLEMIIKGK